MKPIKGSSGGTVGYILECAACGLPVDYIEASEADNVKEAWHPACQRRQMEAIYGRSRRAAPQPS